MTSNSCDAPTGIPVAAHTLRILCVHDSQSNASELKKEFHKLGNLLYKNHSIDLVYVNSPLIVPECESSLPQSINHHEQIRVWWDGTKEPNNSALSRDRVDFDDSQSKSQYCVTVVETSTHPKQDENQSFLGLDASLMLLRQIWASCPFYGIIGVGQGAAIVSLFVTILESDLVCHAQMMKDPVCQAHEGTDDLVSMPSMSIFPQLIIFISGDSIISVDEPLLVHFNGTNSFMVPYVLHMVDNNISPEQELLIRQFPNNCAVEYRRHQRTDPLLAESKNRRVFSTHDLNLIGRFICQRRKALFAIDTTRPQSIVALQRQVLTLQTALFYAEQDAVNCVADVIASNPPSSLMAIIRPQIIAGWSGNRRLQPEGGGAPCPKDFLQRDRRSNHPSTTSASHDDFL